MEKFLTKRALRLAAAAVLLCAVTQAQQPAETPGERASLEGTVVNAQTGRVVPRANVVVRNLKRMAEARSVHADGQGHFLIKNVAPGSYRLTAEHQSYFSGTRHQIFQYRVDLVSGEQRGGITLTLQPAGVVTGQITDENSEPLQHVQIQLLDRVYRGGRIGLETVGTALSDDRGSYRIYDVRPGNYFLTAEVQHGAPQAPAGANARPRPAGDTPPESDIAYSPAFYPDATDFLQAQQVAVGPGDEAHANFAFVAKPSVSISGRVVNGVTGEPAPHAAIATLWTEYLDIAGVIVNATPKEANFSVRGLAPGVYTLRAAFAEDGVPYTVQRRVEVGPTGLENVTLDAVPDTAVAGRMHVEVADQQQRFPQKIEIDFQSNTSPSHASAVTTLRPGASAGLPELGFEARLHPGDQYTVSARGLPENYYLKSVQVNGRQVERNDVVVSDQQADLALVVSPGGGYIEGLALDEAGQPISASVVLVPEDSQRRIPDLFRKSTSDKEGRFRIRGVPPGNYQLLAFDDVDLNELISQPEILKSFADRAVAVTVEEQMDYVTALKVIRASEELRSPAP
ncbi:MAG TPA: carboxypeptidase-like regulatory domain-containing protein [Candidatus Angelobacter sp.]|nr:carboxypeptidase-like regulatory domain-containing protein [Candidatus Angelobacter sp.]